MAKANINLKELIKRNEEENMKRVNTEIDSTGMAYKIKDSEGNQFVYAGLENGFPVYRCRGGEKHIFELRGYEVVEKYRS